MASGKFSASSRRGRDFFKKSKFAGRVGQLASISVQRAIKLGSELPIGKTTVYLGQVEKNLKWGVFGPDYFGRGAS